MTSILALLALTGIVSALSGLVGSTEDDTDDDAVETTAQGTEGDDILQIEGDLERIDGREGDDLLIGSADNDTLGGGPDDDLLIGGKGDDLLKGGVQHDILVGIGDFEDLDSDALQALENDEAAAEALIQDLLNVPDSSGAETLEGGYGKDLLLMGHGDIATGGDQVDSFAFFDQPLVEGASPAPAEITDFDPETEALILPYEPSGPVPAAVIETQGGDAVITIDGTPKIILRGMGGLLTAEHVIQSAYTPGG